MLRVNSSMKKIKVNECELPIDVLKTGVEVDLSSQKLQVEDAIIIAACINVNTSMNKLNILGNEIGDEGYAMLTQVAEEKGIGSLCGLDEGQTESDLSSKTTGFCLWPIDAKLIA